jgi:2-polyprenyl-3-methyl-5-hydroxy-6-metoxy-1,4-benzoquinol methylase
MKDARKPVHTYEDFRELARDPSLSLHERIGFPDSYREGKEDAIIADLRGKLKGLATPGRTVLDIGCGAGALCAAFVAACGAGGHRLLLVDSPEMLGHLPDRPWVTKVPGRFPVDTAAALEGFAGRIDAIVAYSVLQCVFIEGSVFGFLDACLQLLAPGGELLVGDIPNTSKRKRALNESLGAIATNQIDDAVVLALLARARAAGFDAYLLPQGEDLPVARAREDLLIRRR